MSTNAPSNSPWLIGLSGRARSGKDTVAGILGGLKGYERIALADPLKEMSIEIDPIVAFGNDGEPVHLEELVMDVGWERAKENPEVRRFLQRLGTEGVRRTFGADAWISVLESKLYYILRMRERGARSAAYYRYVVPDIRFPNEAAAIREWGGEVWRVTRPTPEGNSAAAGHASEQVEAIEPDRIILNAGTLEDLREATAAALREAEGLG